MKEDILEQIAEDYYTKKEGLFTKHNLKFRPSGKDKSYISKNDSVHSDIDIIAIDTKDPKKIIVVSCKSWQTGINLTRYKSSIEKAIKTQPEKVTGKRGDWCLFRELCVHKWTDSFLSTLKKELNVKSKETIKLEYIILCTKVTKQTLKHKFSFEHSKIIKDYFKAKKVLLTLQIITIDSMIDEIINKIENKTTPSVENTHLSRTFQLILAAGHKIKKVSNNNK